MAVAVRLEALSMFWFAQQWGFVMLSPRRNVQPFQQKAIGEPASAGRNVTSEAPKDGTLVVPDWYCVLAAKNMFG
jgi:hypothetical protein